MLTIPMDLTFPIPEISNDNALMDLRLITLRMIADIWLDDALDAYQRKGWETLVNIGLIGVDQLKKIQDDNGKPLNGMPAYTTDLRATIIGMTPEQLEIYFMIRFNYTMPYLNTALSYIKGYAKWNLYGDNEWTKPVGEVITLTLPTASDDWNAYQKNDKLMEYYACFPSFLGLVKESPTLLTGESRENLMQGTAPNTTPQINFPGNDYNLGVSEDAFLSFGAVILKVIATAWDNPNLKAQLNYEYDPISPLVQDEYDSLYYANVKKILRDHFDFEFPWAFHLKLVFSDTPSIPTPTSDTSNSPFWECTNPAALTEERAWKWRFRYPDTINSNSNSNSKNYYKGFIRNSITIEIPERPMSPRDNVSLALAKYNAIGPQYPFTCS